MQIDKVKCFLIGLLLETMCCFTSYGRPLRVLYPLHYQETYLGSDKEYKNISKPTEDPDFLLFEDPKTHLLGYKNRKGKIVIPPKYRYFAGSECFNKFGTTIVEIPNAPFERSLYSINKKGKIFQYYRCDIGPDYYKSGFRRYVSKDGKMGFVNFKGQIAIPAAFDFAEPFMYNIPVTFVCKGGVEVCDLEFEKGLQHKLNECCHDKSWKGGTWYLIDQKGKVLLTDSKPVLCGRFPCTTIIHDKKKYKLYHDARNRIYLVAMDEPKK